jgi:hypothetical protein
MTPKPPTAEQKEKHAAAAKRKRAENPPTAEQKEKLQQLRSVGEKRTLQSL